MNHIRDEIAFRLYFLLHKNLSRRLSFWESSFNKNSSQINKTWNSNWTKFPYNISQPAGKKYCWETPVDRIATFLFFRYLKVLEKALHVLYVALHVIDIQRFYLVLSLVSRHSMTLSCEPKFMCNSFLFYTRKFETSTRLRLSISFLYITIPNKKRLYPLICVQDSNTIYLKYLHSVLIQLL